MKPPIPAPVLSTTRDPKTARARVSTATRQEQQIATGEFFNGISERLGILANTTYDSVIKASPTKALVIEDAIIEADFTVADSSNYSVSIGAYVDISNGNSWTYTPLSATPIGRPLNAGVVNDFPTSTIDLGVAGSGLTGNPDYSLYFTDYYLETIGQRESITTTGATFFEKGRQILLMPGQEMLIRTTTGGNSTGTLDLRIIFFVSEIDADLLPSALGAAP